jgi:hypothetical protein
MRPVHFTHVDHADAGFIARRALEPFRPVMVVFGLFVLVMLATAVALFVGKLGLRPAEIAARLHGDEARFLRPRSLAGLLEVAIPHVLAMGLIGFVTLHLGMFARVADPRFIRLVARASAAVALLSIAAGFAVALVAPGLAVAKLASFWAFCLLMLLWLVLLGRIVLRRRA